MSDIVVTKGDDGKLKGVGDKADRAYAKFLAKIRSLEPGDTARFSFKLPRSPGFHKRHFKILAAAFAQQDQFADEDKFREWVQVGAGFCDLVPGPKGIPVAVSRSIAWENLDDADFAEHHAAVIAFMRSVHFTRFMWPVMGDLQADTMINNILGEFGA